MWPGDPLFPKEIPWKADQFSTCGLYTEHFLSRCVLIAWHLLATAYSEITLNTVGKPWGDLTACKAFVKHLKLCGCAWQGLGRNYFLDSPTTFQCSMGNVSSLFLAWVTLENQSPPPLIWDRFPPSCWKCFWNAAHGSSQITILFSHSSFDFFGLYKKVPLLVLPVLISYWNSLWWTKVVTGTWGKEGSEGAKVTLGWPARVCKKSQGERKP